MLMINLLIDNQWYVIYLVAVMILAGYARDLRLFAPIYNLILNKVKSKRAVVALISAITGVLPITGRVTVSAGMLDTIAPKDKSKRQVFGIIDYLSTHHYYLWSPVEKSVIILVATLGISYWTFIMHMLPLLLIMGGVIIFYIFYVLEESEIEINCDKFDLGKVDVKKNPLDYINWTAVIILIIAIIISNIIGYNITSIESIIQSNVSSFGIVSAMAFIGSLILGSSAKFAAITAICVTVYGIEYLPWFFAIDYAGYMLSPAHKCLIISKTYFGTPLKEYYKSILILCGALIITAVASTLVHADEAIDVPTIEIVSGTNYQINQRVDVETFSQSFHLQQTSPGMTSPFIGGFTGNQVDQSVNGIRFTNSMFRTGPNQYYSWIPDAFVQSIDISDGGNVGGTISRTLGISRSYAGINPWQKTLSYKDKNFGIMLNSIRIDDVRTAKGTVPHSSYNQDAIMFQGFLDSNNETTLVHSSSDDLKRTDKWNGGYKSTGYQAPSIYTWDLQQYTLFNHNYTSDKWTLSFGYQNSLENITDANKKIRSNLDIYTINLSYNINDHWSVYSTNMFEYIDYDNGINVNEFHDRYRTNKQGLRWNQMLGPIDVTVSAGIKQVHINKFDTFTNKEGSIILSYNGFFVSGDYSTNAPSYFMIKQSQTTGKGVTIPNSDLDEERALTFRTGYKKYGFYFDIYKKHFIDAFYQSTVAANTFMTVNGGSQDVYGSNFGYKNDSILGSNFGINSRLEYTYGKQDIPSGGREPINKTPQLIAYNKLNWNHWYTEWLYQPKDNALSSYDKADVRIWGQNTGYNIWNMGYKNNYKKLDYEVSVKNLFNDDGRVLGSSTDVWGRMLWFQLEYNF